MADVGTEPVVRWDVLPGEPGTVVALALDVRRLRLCVAMPVACFGFQQEGALHGHAEAPPPLAQPRVGDVGEQLGPAEDLTAGDDSGEVVLPCDEYEVPPHLLAATGPPG